MNLTLNDLQVFNFLGLFCQKKKKNSLGMVRRIKTLIFRE